jgi:hypothetical protein
MENGYAVLQTIGLTARLSETSRALNQRALRKSTLGRVS